MEYKFRGKSKLSIEELDRLEIEHKEGWVFGHLIYDDGAPVITGGVADLDSEYISLGWWVLVEPESVGQYIRIKDKKDVEIYEGDIVEVIEDPSFGVEPINGVVKYIKGSFFTIFHGDPRDGVRLFNVVTRYEVIGNIHEHLHLLEVPNEKR